MSQWRYAPSRKNPADLLSRGTSDVCNFIKCKIWIEGPEFLYFSVAHWPNSLNCSFVSSDDCELKSPVYVTNADNYISPIEKLFTSISSRQKVNVVYYLYKIYRIFET